ncbi:AraC family transcriptional regulator ligand-binding domain-containing protein [Thalassomonas viridans]|uniref:AraC family transcriptional regulator ligand-binding domain-containing protein n=1 Tax=Thalassomonas viridans TaxID=137584 RepID=A0AAE9Z057_9GAMM|nr:AraC family transcriptional regulator [Thalassomonas viridans]WDE03665.1 AraC family transcriptional regulator ligand-binding domain-containing protein [Thalassomonas viridans]
MKTVSFEQYLNNNNLNNNKVNNSHLVPYSFIRRQLGSLIREPEQALELLAQHDIPASVLTSEGYIESEKLGNLANSVWRQLDDESAGASAKKLHVGSFKMLCHACSDCKTLRSVIHRTMTFFRLLSDEYRFALEVKGEEAIFILRHRPETQTTQEKAGVNNDYFILCLAIVFIRWFAWLIDQQLKLERVEFEFSPFAAQQDFEAIFQSKVDFSQTDNRLVFAASMLNQAVVAEQEKLPSLLISAPFCFLSHYQQQNSTAEQVRKILSQSEDFSRMKLADLAARLHFSPATLTRKLKAENTSFMDIKDRTRKHKALTLLRTTEQPVTSISYELGFSEASAFTRAFKKWTGENPLEYRNSYRNS